MTDNELLKALECCETGERRCAECPLPEDERHLGCCDDIKLKAVAVIRRQRSEIKILNEMLKKAIEESGETNDKTYDLR